MDKVVARRLRPWDRRKLHQMKRQRSNAVNSRNGRIILLSRGGVCNHQIAQCVDCTPAWVRQVIHRFNDGGVDAITWYPAYCRRGGPVKFLAEVTEQTVEIALTPPKQLIGMSVWSLAKLRDYLLEQGVVETISIERLREILRQRRIRWRHTKTWKESNDPRFWPKYRRIRRLYRRRPADGVRLCIDEFGPLNLQPRHGRHYVPTEHVDRRRATYSRTGGVRHFMGVYDMERDTLRGRFVRCKHTGTFLSFLKWVRRQYADRGVLHSVLDNASYHLKDEVLEYAAVNRIKFYWTLTGASWLNRIEAHFASLRKFTMNNTHHQSHDEQEAAISQYQRWRNRRRTLSIQDWQPHARPLRRAA